MSWSNYIPLLIVFIVIFRSLTKEAKENKQEKIKTNLPHRKSKKKATENKIQKNKNTIQAKITKAGNLKVFPTRNNTMCVKTNRLNNDFSSDKEIDEIRHIFVWAEILNKKFYDN